MRSQALHHCWYVLTCTALLGCRPCSQSPAEGLTGGDKAAILALDSVFVRGWLDDDTARVLSVFNPNAVLLPPGSNPVGGLSGIRAYWWPEDGSHTRVFSFEHRITEIEGTRHLAYVRGTATLGWTYRKGASPTRQTSRSVDLILVAPDSSGRWRVVRQMWSALPT